MNKFKLLLTALLTVSSIQLSAHNFKQLKDLSGFWKFSVGDNPKWAEANFDDSDWDKIQVPSKWENQGYDDYDGFAWYRKTFHLGNLNESNIYLLLGRIDDADEVYLNGKLIAKRGEFPPNFRTMYYKDREYMIPEDKLIENTENTIAIRVYDSHLEGGILSGRVGLFYNYDDKYIDIPLSGTWKFKTGKNKDWNKRKFPDSNWDEINVPQNWDSQGYEDYDGDACYRKTFNIPAGADIKNQYLVLGKIDDYDKVYLNGEYIGSYKTVKHGFNYPGEKDVWRNIRYYPIPDNLLVKGENYISVNVHDTHLDGGIYDGPIGITSKSNYQKLKSKY